MRRFHVLAKLLSDASPIHMYYRHRVKHPLAHGVRSRRLLQRNTPPDSLLSLRRRVRLARELRTHRAAIAHDKHLDHVAQALLAPPALQAPQQKK